MITVRVPATSANMGPGFDSIGIALNLYNTFYMEESDSIEISATHGEHVPSDDSNLIYQCAKRVYDICGKPMPGLKLIEDCDIPQTRGLGSSSACTVAGLIGANALLGNPLHQENIIDLAAAIEGHPDNSTPAILGGFCTSLLEYGKVWSVRVPIADKLDFVAFIPNFELSTEKARQAIPRTIPHKDAVFNLSRAALLTGSLVTGDLHNLMVAAGDRVGGVSKSRSRTWVQTLLMSSGGWAPNRSSTAWVSSLICPSRAAQYCRCPRAFFSAA